MKKLLFIPFLILCLLSFGQSEPHTGMITVDTLITQRSLGFTNSWWVQITYYRGDTIHRPALIFADGAGEVGTDSSNLSAYGAAYWLQNGWNGGIQLGNGTHYCIYVKIQPPAATQGGNQSAAIIDTLIKYYPIRAGSIHVSGLSDGGYQMGQTIQYAAFAGDTSEMIKIKSFVCLQGVSATPPKPNTFAIGYPQAFGHWATKFGGRFFGLQGTTDGSRNVWQYSENMNDSTANTAFFTYENIGGGGHGFWNQMYDPSVTDWTSANPNVVPNFISGHPSTSGNYTTGSIFQWMLRQGDTTLLGQSADTLLAADLIFVGGEYVTGKIKNGKAYSITDNANLAGAGGTVNKGGQTAISSPAGVVFANGTNTLHGLTFVSTKGYGYSFGGNDQGQLGIRTIGSNVTTPTLIALDSAGTDSVINLRFCKGFYGGNVGQGQYLVKKGPVSDTLFATGDRRFGLSGDGTLGDTTSAPVIVWIPGHHILQIAAERYAFANLDDGTVWATGGASTTNVPPNYAWLGYTGSGNQYLTWHQVTGFDDSIRQIAGGHLGGIALSKNGKLWGWGLHSAYLGNAGDISYSTPHDLTDSVTTYVPGGIKEISANSNAYYILSNLDSAYAFGDNSMAAIGNGIEKNMQTLSPNPYSYDPAAILGLMQYHPTLVNHKGNWAHHYSEPIFGFTSFWVDDKDSVYINGRNKGAVLGNGVTECVGAGGNQQSLYPNSWDVVNATRVTQDTILHAIPVICPGCVNGAVTTNCGLCTAPSTTPHSVAGTNQQLTFGTTATQLNGTGSSSTGGSVLTYTWTQTAGTPAIIVVPSSPTPEIKGLSTGTSTFQLTITDNGTRSDVSTVNVTVGGGNSIPIPYGSKIIAH